jgi:pyruvate formate lyase activating enzyme
MSDRFIRESLLQEKINGKVRCLVCERRCTIVEGGLGWCRTRRNRDGRLYTLIYGAVSSISANPIEKKPLYHFYPSTVALTVGSWSCNFGCPWCQNWDISKSPPQDDCTYFSPDHFIDQAIQAHCQGTSISLNEPTLSLDWSLDMFRLARERGLYNTFVTNGYMTEAALDRLIKAGLDAMNVDVKGDAESVRRYCKGVDVEVVWRNCRAARQAGVHVEITTLVVPTVNDDEATLRGIATRIASELGPSTPWHVSGYYPAYRFTVPRTPMATLERARAIGREAGLDFVYIGNVLGHPAENTYCPRCEALLIQRYGLSVIRNVLRSGACPKCGSPIAGVWDQFR